MAPGKSNWRSIIAVSGLLFCLIAAISIVTSMRSEPTRRTVAINLTSPIGTAAQPAVRYSDGTIVSFLGVRNFPHGETWFGANGTKVPPQTAPIPLSVGFSGRMLEVRLDLQGERPRTSEVRLRFPGQRPPAMNSIAVSGGAQFSAIFWVPPDLANTTAEFGIARGPWQTIVVAPFPQAAQPTTSSATTGQPPGRQRHRTPASA